MRRGNPQLIGRRADEALEGLLQWLAGHAAAPHHEQSYVMLLGDVDEAFHAFILNTRLYMRFCKEHVGFFIHHTPADEELAAELQANGSLRYTVNFLEDAFGESLSPSLCDWCDGVRSGRLGAAAVSCLWKLNSAEDPSILAHFGLTDITQRWSS
jgi:hypothetical protein